MIKLNIVTKIVTANRLMFAALTVLAHSASGGNIAYIHGDVASNGNVPSGGLPAFEQMLLTNTSNKGTSEFRAMIQGEGHTINQYYDQATTLNAAFLNQFDAIVFGLHQKIWSAAEKSALNTWLQAGGGMMVYSDSAAGGAFGSVGLDNPVGQNVLKNLTAQYGMQVTRDQATGTKAFQATAANPNPIVNGLVFEGEGISPIVVDSRVASIEVLIPYNQQALVAGGTNLFRDANTGVGIPSQFRRYAAVARRSVGSGNIIGIFDRQPLFNAGGPGSDITKRNNREVLRRIINFLAGNSNSGGSSPVNFQFNSSNAEGWARSGSIEAHAFTAQGEYLVRAAPNSDPFIFNNGVSFSGSDTTEIRVRMKAQASGVVQLFWGTSQAGAGGFSANRVKTVSYPTANVYQELVFNMSGESAWVGKTITNLRVDTTTASNPSHTWFDYIVGNGNGGGSNPSGFVFLRKRSAIGFAMDGGAGGQNNQNVNMQGYNTSDLGQQWEEISRGNSFYTYKKRNTNFVLDGGAGLASNGDNVYLWSEGATNQNQHWKKINVGGGYYRLEKRNANTHSIDGGGGAGFNGQNVKLWVNGNSNQNQHWRIE